MTFDAELIHVDPEYILQRVSEEQIVYRYFGINVRPGAYFCSPLRSDENPTCQFSYHKGKLRYRDWAESRSRDVFDMIKEKFHLSYYQSIERIALDMKVGTLQPDPSILQERERRIGREKAYAGKSLIQVKEKAFSDADKAYLKSFGINGPICKRFRVQAVSHVWIGGRLEYTYRPHDPAFCYHFGEADGEDRFKIYFYNRKRGERGMSRFYCNTNRIQGWVQLPSAGELVVLTKSLKDVMSLDRLGVPAISMQNETTEPYPRIIAELESRFDSIVSLYDPDVTGRAMAEKLEATFEIQPIYVPASYGSKDISDLIRDHGLEVADAVFKDARRSLGL